MFFWKCSDIFCSGSFQTYILLEVFRYPIYNDKYIMKIVNKTNEQKLYEIILILNMVVEFKLFTFTSKWFEIHQTKKYNIWAAKVIYSLVLIVFNSRDMRKLLWYKYSKVWFLFHIYPQFFDFDVLSIVIFCWICVTQG